MAFFSTKIFSISMSRLNATCMAPSRVRMTGELVSASGVAPGGVAHDDASFGAVHAWGTCYQSVLPCYHHT